MRKYDATEWIDFALNLCRGSYQRNLLRGTEYLSGSNLRGKAASYRGRYNASRDALLERMTKAGIPWTIVKTDRQRLSVAGIVL